MNEGNRKSAFRESNTNLFLCFLIWLTYPMIVSWWDQATSQRPHGNNVQLVRLINYCLIELKSKKSILVILAKAGIPLLGVSVVQ